MSTGAFYLGRRWDPASAAATSDPVLYPSRHLVTHAVIVGMTGSGKTGLGTIILEEAGLAGIPVLAIDPKGDLGNLLLTFPALRPEDFAPFVPAGEDPAAVAARARQGIEASGQPLDRLARLAATERVLFTPGSRLARPLSLMPSLSAPAATLEDDAVRDRAIASASAVLALAGVEADAVRSPEHALLSNVLLASWRAGHSLDPAAMLRSLVSPPFERLGVMDLESVIPARARQQLAVAINAALASPSLAGMLEGDPLDVQSLLCSPTGAPRTSILSIAHLSDAERMFFVTALLGELLAWVRSREGTQSLRAILYMDEIAGFFPPVAAPPSKAPMLTLLKQARAFGLGVVLATQNPVDLDYKGLSNTGTWMLGRLQTERDKLRVLDGLESADSGGIERSALDAMLSGLGPRVFLMHDVHTPGGPTPFQTRWALSYLRGPLSREHIKRLAQPVISHPAPAPAPPPPSRPVLDAEIEETFVVRHDLVGPRIYRPGLAVRAHIHYADPKAAVDAWLEPLLVVPLTDEGPQWSQAWVLDRSLPEAREPAAEIHFAPLPSSATRKKSYAAWEKQAVAHVVRDRPLELWWAPELAITSRLGEAREVFAARAIEQARREMSAAVEKLDAKWSGKLEKARAKLEVAERRLASATMERDVGVLDAGADMLGALIGGRRSIARAARTNARRAAQSSEKRTRAREQAEAARLALDHLERELAEERADLERRLDPRAVRIEPKKIVAKKTAIRVDRVTLVWVPSPA